MKPPRSLLRNNFWDETTKEVAECSGTFIRNVQVHSYVAQRNGHQTAEASGSHAPTRSTERATTPLNRETQNQTANDGLLTSKPPLPAAHEGELQDRVECATVEKHIYQYQYIIARWNRLVDRHLMTTSIVMLSSALIALQNYSSLERVRLLFSIQTTRAVLQQVHGIQPNVSRINSTPYEIPIFFSLFSFAWGALATMLCLWVKRRLSLATCFPDCCQCQDHPNSRLSHLQHHFTRLETFYVPRIIKYLPVFPPISIFLLLSGVTSTCATFSPVLAILGALVVFVYAASSFGMIMELRKDDPIYTPST